MSHRNDDIQQHAARAPGRDNPVTSAGESRLAFSPDEAADLLGISRELVFGLLRTGQLKSVKAGRRRLISRQHLDAFLAGDAA
jgi:excisionase family DNA binding protein